MNLEGWRLYYPDSTFSSADGSWAQAPSEGVQVLMLYLARPYRELITGVDEYRLPGRKTVKYGSWISLEDFERIQAEAMADMDWP